MSNNQELFDGDVSLAIEQESVHLKAVDEHGDPIELNADMCRILANKLAELAAAIDD